MAKQLSPVAILGPGLIGGSLGLALQRLCPDVEIRVWARRDAALEAVRALGFARIADTNVGTVVAGARTVVLCTPVETMAGLSQQILDSLDPAAAVTDAGSVKNTVVPECEAILGGRFVGAHPIAGSDRAGIDAAHADLFENATCVLTPTSHTDPAALETVRTLWKSVGCSLVEMSAESHDAALARTSHLPHAAAAALASVVAREVAGWQSLAGGGYRDSTRIAMGNPDLWTGILMANRAEVSTSIAEFIEILQNIRSALEAGDGEAVHALLAQGRDARHQLDVF
ncbi:MAG: prephenate dehydrogenase [Chthoniobacterales bacterium]